MNIFLILPHQLFNKKYLNHKYDYIIWEHPYYFTRYNFNKKKLMLHSGSMKYYYDYLKDNKFNVKYYNFDKIPNLENYKLFDPIDKIELPGNYEILESPNFLLEKKNYEKYRNKSKNFLFNSFYMFGKKELQIIPDIKSKDKYNRKTPNKNIIFPKLPNNLDDSKYIDLSVKYVNENFNDNYGNTENFIYPLTHKTAKKWLKDFIEKRFDDFGPYQDYINDKNNFLNHSILSSSINIGLLNPSDIISEIMKYKNKIKINSFEGYIRQLFWREYQRYCYIYYDFTNKNYFSNKKKLTRKWYDGKTGIEPVDNCIKNAFNTGYLHHIERLMVIGNYMNLSGIDPNEGFRWFMEFSCDSYEWVMHQNVYDMIFFVSGGVTMRRPYISSSNYILKMSNYKKDDWCFVWNEKYNNFLKKNRDKLWKFRYYFRGLK